MKVRNMNGLNGTPVKNQFIIDDENGNIFFKSYNSIIVKKDDEGKVFLDKKYYNYSSTTVKYRNMFLQEDSKIIEHKIKTGEYVLCNLN
jgi:hypothetical protein